MEHLTLLATAAQGKDLNINFHVEIFGGLIGYVLTSVALWPLFVKAGRPGWGALIPIYNVYLLVKIARLHGACVLLYVVPIANIIVGIIVAIRVGRAFGKGMWFSLFLLWLLPIIGYFIVGYGRSRFRSNEPVM